MNKKSRNDGQVIIEFIVVSFISIMAIYLLIQLCFILSYGAYVQYASYMAARSYYAGNVEKANQIEAAEKTLNELLRHQQNSSEMGSFFVRVIGTPLIGEGELFEVSEFSNGESGKGRYNDGVRIMLRSPFNLFDTIFTSWFGKSTAKLLDYESISYFGREFNESECRNLLKEKMEVPAHVELPEGGVYYDNGC